MWHAGLFYLISVSIWAAHGHVCLFLHGHYNNYNIMKEDSSVLFSLGSEWQLSGFVTSWHLRYQHLGIQGDWRGGVSEVWSKISTFEYRCECGQKFSLYESIAWHSHTYGCILLNYNLDFNLDVKPKLFNKEVQPKVFLTIYKKLSCT